MVVDLWVAEILPTPPYGHPSEEGIFPAMLFEHGLNPLHIKYLPRVNPLLGGCPEGGVGHNLRSNTKNTITENHGKLSTQHLRTQWH